MNHHLPIGIFDSGVGGLTVLSSLKDYLPNESYLYLGDTARLPYGTKSADTVTRYAINATTALVDMGIKLLIVACNTASSVALTALQEHFSDIPVIGVIEPSAQAACQITNNQHIAVIATEATVQAQSYQRAIKQRLPNALINTRSCSVFIALAEEGWIDNGIAVQAAEKYLTPLLVCADHERPDVLILGCTHFPLLQPAISRVVNSTMQIVSSAQATAAFVKDYVVKHDLSCDSKIHPTNQLLVTDNLERFSSMAELFLQQKLVFETVQLVNLSNKMDF